MYLNFSSEGLKQYSRTHSSTYASGCFVGGSVTALAMVCLGGAGGFAADPDKAVDKIHTATPIKHVLIIVGENRCFDHLYATYVPKNRDERVLNLLSERIINADGSPGKNFAKAHQFRVTSAPNNGKYFVSVDLKNKSLYGVLPAPDMAGCRRCHRFLLS
jgi:phospholipase C